MMSSGLPEGPPSARSSIPAARDLAHRIGQWAEHFEPSSQRMVRIRACVRDYVGCVAAGTLQPELRPALWLAHGGGVPIWGMADSFDPAGAALIMGTAGALLQLHDVYSPGSSHPSAPVISAAWAALHSNERIAPHEFSRAVAAGYEVANRIADACVPAQLFAGSSPTGTAGALGAAVAAGLIRGLDARGIGRAVSNTALLLPATPFAAMRAHGALVPLHPGIAARAGYEGASLARDGDSGLRILEGDEEGAGLIALLGGNPATIDPQQWNGETIDAVGWKFFPACLATHIALEAALRLERVDISTIDRVVVRRPVGSLDSMVARGPVDGCLYDRLMSLRWVLARALELGQYEYPDAVRDSPTTLELARKIELLPPAPNDLSASGGPWICIEVFSAGRLSARIHYDRSSDADHRAPGVRGWTMKLDELALRKKFDALVARAPVASEHLKLLGLR